VVAQNLKRDDVQQTLQTIYSLGNPDRLGTRRDAIVALIAQNDGLGLPRSDLRERRLDLGIQRVLGHDDDNRHVLVNQRERAMLELASEDTYNKRRLVRHPRKTRKYNVPSECM